VKKILLIEDRYERQYLFRQQTGIDLEKYNNILDNCIEDKYNTFINDILIGDFNLGAYDIIITHKSAFGNDNDIILKKLEKHCQGHNKPLVLFSGGIVGNYYNSEVYEVLELNSKIFYSQNLVLFIEAIKEQNENILMLAYGRRWKLNIILNVIENLNLYIDTKDFDLRKYVNINSLEPLNIMCDFVSINDSIEKLTEFRDCLLNIVRDEIDD
jgi:hypothetical protein